MNYKPLVYLMIAAALFSCSHPAPPPPPPPTAVNVYSVKKGSAQYYNSYPATVTSVNEVEVRPQVAGYISGIYFKEGQHVEKGQKLYSIDEQQYRGAYEQAVAQLRVDEANLAKLQQDDRYEELGKQDAIAQQNRTTCRGRPEAGKNWWRLQKPMSAL
jgi:membrane fusion protein (multidrug efflux system)